MGPILTFLITFLSIFVTFLNRSERFFWYSEYRDGLRDVLNRVQTRPRPFWKGRIVWYHFSLIKIQFHAKIVNLEIAGKPKAQYTFEFLKDSLNKLRYSIQEKFPFFYFLQRLSKIKLRCKFIIKELLRNLHTFYIFNASSNVWWKCFRSHLFLMS